MAELREEGRPKGRPLYNGRMDLNTLAKKIVDEATSEEEESAKTKATRASGRKGGPARAKKLSAKRRSEIARIAAQARWKKAKPGSDN